MWVVIYSMSLEFLLMYLLAGFIITQHMHVPFVSVYYTAMLVEKQALYWCYQHIHFWTNMILLCWFLSNVAPESLFFFILTFECLTILTPEHISVMHPNAVCRKTHYLTVKRLGVGQNISTAIYHCPSSCDKIIDTLVPNIDILINKIWRSK